MADEAFDGVALAVGVQSALGTVNGTIAALSGSIGSSDGCVLGVLDQGDANSGITLPELIRVGREKAELASFTKQPTTYLRTDVSGLAIACEMKGNGATATPASGEAKPLTGLDVLWEALCLEGANGTAPVYEYTPATGVSDKYLTAKLWAGDQSWVYMDALVSAEIVLTPGNIGVVTFNFEVGSLYAQADGVTFPTVDYTTQSTLSAPTVQKPTSGDTHEWPSGTAKGFNAYSLALNTNLTKVPDSNQATGERVILEGRDVELTMTSWILAADTDFEYEELIRTTISTSAEVTQVGDVAGATDTINAYKIELLEPEVAQLKYNRIGTALVVESIIKGTSDAAGGDFKLTFN